MNAAKTSCRQALSILIAASLVSIPLASQANTTQETLSDMTKVQSQQEKQIQSEKNLMNQQLQSLTDEMKKIESATLMNQYLIDTAPMAQLGGVSGCDQGGSAAFAAKSPVVPLSKVPYARGGTGGIGGSGGTGGAGSGSTNTVFGQVDSFVKADDCKMGENALYDPTCTADQVDNMIGNLFFPYPQQALSGDQAKTPSSTSFTYHMDVLRANESLASNAKTLISNDYRTSPDITNAQIQGIAGLIGVTNPPSAPISHAGLMDMVVKGTYANSDWYTWLNQTNKAGAMRALAMLKAMRAEQDQRKQDLMNYMVVLIEVKASNNQSSRVDKVNDARDASVSQSLRGVTKQ